MKLPRGQLYLCVFLLLAAGWRLREMKGRRSVALDVCHAQVGGAILKVRGSPYPIGRGRWALNVPEVKRKTGWDPFAGDVEIDPLSAEGSSVFGRLVEISGHFSCALTPRNPGTVSDGLSTVRPPKLLGLSRKLSWAIDGPTASIKTRAQLAFADWLHTRFSEFPRLRAFVVAVWTGDVSGLPPEVIAFHTEAGMLQALALSGQHVACLVLLVSLLMKTVSRFVGGRCYLAVQPLLPVASAGVLWITSPAAAPMQRTLAMALAWLLLRARRLECSLLQLVLSSAAIMILWEPALIASASFYLSVASTAALGAVWGGVPLGRAWLRYLSVSITMPVLAAPLGAFFFAKAAMLAPVWSLIFSVAWDVVLIPLGFLAPFLPRWSFIWLEGGLVRWANLHATLGPANHRFFWSSLRPTLVEVLVLEVLVLILVLWSMPMRK